MGCGRGRGGGTPEDGDAKLIVRCRYELAEVPAKQDFREATVHREAAADLGWRIAERAGRFVLGTAVGLFVARHLGPERLGRR